MLKSIKLISSIIFAKKELESIINLEMESKKSIAAYKNLTLRKTKSVVKQKSIKSLRLNRVHIAITCKCGLEYKIKING